MHHFLDSDIGTIIHVAPKEEIEAVLPTISDVRYIGYINCDEGIRTKNYVPYVGIPVSNNYMQNIPVEKEMWKVKYPHITLSRTMSADQLKIIGKTIRFKLAYNYNMGTNMGTNMAMIHGVQYHVTRWVDDAKEKAIEKMTLTEFELQFAAMDLVGYPVFM